MEYCATEHERLERESTSGVEQGNITVETENCYLWWKWNILCLVALSVCVCVCVRV